MLYKTCTYCGQLLPISQFRHRNGRPRGARCYPCRAAYQRARYRANLEAMRQWSRDYYRMVKKPAKLRARALAVANG